MLPIDPEDETLAEGRVGMHKLASILRTFYTELLTEGFDEAEAYGLTEAWMIQALVTADA